MFGFENMQNTEIPQPVNMWRGTFRDFFTLSHCLHITIYKYVITYNTYTIHE